VAVEFLYSKNTKRHKPSVYADLKIFKKVVDRCLIWWYNGLVGKADSQTDKLQTTIS
jgi:hypothetical protein